jgi:hypothetical protein
MTSYYHLKKSRKIPGLENAKYVDPYSGSKGNTIRYLSVAPSDLCLNSYFVFDIRDSFHIHLIFSTMLLRTIKGVCKALSNNCYFFRVKICISKIERRR